MRLRRAPLSYETPECPSCTYRIWVKTTLGPWMCNKCGTPATSAIVKNLVKAPQA